MVDLHCHVLPGIDDGPRTIEDSLALTRRAAVVGVTTLVATSHVSERYPNTPSIIATALARLRDAVAAAAIDIEVVGGAEIELTMLARLSDADLTALRLGSGRHLLLECPLSSAAGEVTPMLMRMLEGGERFVLAHPERCPEFQRHPERLGELVEAGALTSVTAGALVGRFGVAARRCALDLINGELVHNVASDFHDLRARPPGILAEIEASACELTGLMGQAAWLTDAVPSAIIADGALPVRPPRPKVQRGGILSRLRQLAE